MQICNRVNKYHMLETLVKAISNTVQLNDEDIALCNKLFEPISVAKNTVVHEQDKVPQYIYFVAQGYMRLFYYDANGDEQTTYLCSPNGFITPFLPFINQVKTNENVECITNCELLQTTNANLKQLIEQSENFKKFSLVIFEQAIASTSIRANDLATLNAEQRYKKLITQQPLLVQNVPIQYIASYLGMKPESLSRIRRQMIS